METSIKTDLFRFATLRGPQLLTDDEKQTGFIFFNPSYQTPPVDSPPNPSALRASSNAQSSLTYNSPKDVNDINTGLFSFGQWLSKNRRNNNFISSYLQERTSSLSLLDDSSYMAIWDCLIQLQSEGTKKQALKEALVQMLVANHFVTIFRGNFPIESQEPGLDEPYPYFYTTANAKVVIPNEQVIRNTKSFSQQSTSVNEAALAQSNKLQETLAKLNDYQTATDDLLSADKQYKLDTAAAYQTAFEAHQAAWMAYLDTIEATIDPETNKLGKSIPDNATTRALQKFSFEPEPVLSGYLEGKVSATTLSVVSELNLYRFQSIGEAVTEIEARMRQLGNNFSTSDANNTVQTLVFNGSVWEANTPASTKLPTDTLYGYQICSIYESNLQQQHFDIEINAGYTNLPPSDPAPSVSSVSYQAHILNGATHVNTQFSTISVTGSTIKFRIFPNSTLSAPSANVYLVQGTITFSNGKAVTFEKTLKGTVCAAGVAKLVGSGNGDEDTAERPAESIIGIQQLGIADYRKITQETCCYVPGEVSHIENVLKGEYKERSTRRLLRTEETTETSVDTETENLTDVSSTERNEMHSEVSKVLASDKSFTANASVSGKIPLVGSFSAGAGYASNTAQTDSTSQAISYAKDVTTRAMERVLQKVSEKRTRKMIDEYEENNKHGYDNRGIGAQNVSGVYRWVDKIYKNQLVNYGRRLMYEIMVPEPARFLSTAAAPASTAMQVLGKPVDPRTIVANAGLLGIANYQQLAAQYSASVAAYPSSIIKVSKAVKMECGIAGATERQALAEEMDIPEGYAATSAQCLLSYYYFPDKMEESQVTVNVGNHQHNTSTNIRGINQPFTAYNLGSIEKKLAIGIRVTDLAALSLTVVAECQITAAALMQWQAETYQAILDAYQDQKTAYDDALANAQATTGVTRYNPLQSRMIEMGELKKNCLQLLLEPFGYTTGVDTLRADGRININPAFGNHAAKVRFFEAAFEWEIMSYIFYPYLWADESRWKELFTQSDADTLFSSFLQAGMARVVLSVRPGYEEAVIYYLETGKINEGKDMAIDDDLYLSLLAEQLPVDGIPEGEPWETRLPTTLTVLQSDSVAVAATGLPCNCIDAGQTSGFISTNNSLYTAGIGTGGGGANPPDLPNPNPSDPTGGGPIDPAGPGTGTQPGTGGDSGTD